MQLFVWPFKCARRSPDYASATSRRPSITPTRAVDGVFSKDNGPQLFGDRGGLAIPDVIQVLEFERQLRAGRSLELEVDLTGRAIRRGRLVVVEEVNLDGAVRRELIPDR